MNSLSVKRKRTLSFHWEFAVATLFVGQPKREKLSFRSYPSLFRGELKIEIVIILRKEIPKPFTTPPSLSSPKKKICIHMFPSELCPRLLLTDAIWKSDWRGKKSTLIRHCQCGLGRAELFTSEGKMTLGKELLYSSS